MSKSVSIDLDAVFRRLLEDKIHYNAINVS